MDIRILLTKLFSFRKDRKLNRLGVTAHKIVRDLTYIHDDDSLKLDVFLPKQEGPLPVILNLHGGSLVTGNKNVRRRFASYMTGKGFAVVNISYGTAPKYKFPNQTKNCLHALQWIADNAFEYGFDTEKIIVCGDSAGGYLACQTVTALTNHEYADALGFTLPNTKIKGVLLFSGLYDPLLSLKAKYPFNAQFSLAKAIFDIDYEKANPLENCPLYDYISPIPYITENFPPTFVAHTVMDKTCKGQGKLLVDALQSHGVTVHEFKAVHEKCKHAWHLYQGDSRAEACLVSASYFIHSVCADENVMSEYIEI